MAERAVILRWFGGFLAGSVPGEVGNTTFNAGSSDLPILKLLSNLTNGRIQFTKFN